jgi:hypothetical protein
MTPKFNLNDSQRIIFKNKILPTIFAGSVIWLISELIFGSIFTKVSIPGELFFAIYIPMIIADIVLYITFYFLSKKGNVVFAIIMYFLFAICAGIITVPISILTVLDVNLRIYVHGFVSLVMAGGAIVFIIAMLLQERFFTKEYRWVNVLMFILGIFLMAIAFILIYQIRNIILMIISIVVLTIITSLVLFYGASLTRKVQGDNWIGVVFRVLQSLLIFSFLVFLVFLTFLLMIASEGDFDIAGLGDISGSSRSRSSKKKRRAIESALDSV